MPGPPSAAPPADTPSSPSTSPPGRPARRHHHPRPGGSPSRPAASCFGSPRRPRCWRSRGRRCTSSCPPAKSLAASRQSRGPHKGAPACVLTGRPREGSAGRPRGRPRHRGGHTRPSEASRYRSLESCCRAHCEPVAPTHARPSQSLQLPPRDPHRPAEPHGLKRPRRQAAEGMSADRTAAVWIGVLCIIGTVVFVLTLVVAGGILAGPACLAQVAAQPHQVAIGALLAGFALALVPVVVLAGRQAAQRDAGQWFDVRPRAARWS